MPIIAGVFELEGISGVSMANGSDVIGIRLAFPHPELGLFDDKDLILAMDAPDMWDADARYTRVSWQVPTTRSGVRKVARRPRKSVNSPTFFDFDPEEATRITLCWHYNGTQVVGRYLADAPTQVGLFVNGCFAPAKVTAAADHACTITQGDSALHVHLSGQVHAVHQVDTRLQAEHAAAGLPTAEGAKMAFYQITLSPATPLYFTLTLTPKNSAGMPGEIEREEIDRALAAAADSYTERRMRSTGTFTEAAEVVAGLSGFGRTYDPRRQMVQTTVNRSWGSPNIPGLIFGWDNFFCAYLAAWESPTMGAAALEHIVSVYGEQETAHGPTQRNLIIPIVYCRTLDIVGDESLAQRTWPTMISFMRFWFSDRGDGRPWRDGNGDGLIESGTNVEPATLTIGQLYQSAMDETGYDELPVYSDGFADGRRGLLADGVDFDWPSRALTVTLVCQNSLYIASCRTMARWADRLGKTDDAAWLRQEAARVAERMRERLYMPSAGMYRDRYWSGDFSPVKAMTLFYPLLAGIADEPMQARLREMLLDPAQFWGENLIPTVSRDDPTYCDGLDGRGNYWRGNCWPPTTYIVYLAVKEAGWDDIAAQYATIIHRQFMDYWKTYGHAYENYPAEGRVDTRYLYPGGWGGRDAHYVWSALLPLCGLEEIFAPETSGEGIRFGNPHIPTESAWTHFMYAGVSVDAIAGLNGPKSRMAISGNCWQNRELPSVHSRKATLSASLQPLPPQHGYTYVMPAVIPAHACCWTGETRLVQSIIRSSPLRFRQDHITLRYSLPWNNTGIYPAVVLAAYRDRIWDIFSGQASDVPPS